MAWSECDRAGRRPQRRALPPFAQSGSSLPGFATGGLAPVRRPLRVSVGSGSPAMEALRTLSRRTLAAATAVLIFVALAFAYWVDVTNNEEGEGDVVGWLIVSAVASLIAAALLVRFVPATESDPDGDNKPARRGLILSVLSVVTLAVFWTGLPFALAVPALALAATGRARAPQEGHGGQATVAAVLAALAIVLALVVCVTG